MLPNEEVVDYYGKDEILFMGPDEGTAEFMDWGECLLSCAVIRILILY